MADPVVLIMAAGQSRRFGSQKLLHPLQDGRAILAHTVQIYRSLGLPVLVITGNDQSVHQLLNELGAPFHINEKANLGLGHSIASGIFQLAENNNCLIALGDMPFIAPSTVEKVALHLTSDLIVRPTFQGKAGHPVGFGQSFFNDLKALNEDRGAQLILHKYPHHCLSIPVDDPMILRDIDTSADL